MFVHWFLLFMWWMSDYFHMGLIMCCYGQMGWVCVYVCVLCDYFNIPASCLPPLMGGSSIEKTNCTSLSFQLPPVSLIPIRCLFKALMPDKECYTTPLNFLLLCFLWPEAYCALPPSCMGSVPWITQATL